MAPKESCKQMLLEFNFTNAQINALFKNEPGIVTIEDALQKFEKTALGFQHKFVPDRTPNNFCLVCLEGEKMHYEYNLKRLETGTHTYDQIENEVLMAPQKQKSNKPKNADIQKQFIPKPSQSGSNLSSIYDSEEEGFIPAKWADPDENVPIEEVVAKNRKKK